ncbi:MAG: hypothetical protein GXP45_06775 [bacterium]|nr:hypothetical protein [bacterium]
MKKYQHISYGINTKANAFIESYNKNGIRRQHFQYQGQDFHFQCPISSRHQLTNLA